MKTSVGLGCLMWMVASASCFQTKDIPPAPGGETNFLRACDKSCSDGLSCVCGVCTRKCTSDNSCNTLDANAVCLSSDAIGDTRMCEPGQRHEAAVCDARCSANRDCRKGLSCQGGLCREEPQVSGGPNAGTGGAVDAGPPTPTGDPLDPNAPLVMLLIDTSGSLSDMPGCTCASPTDCTNCEPDCAGGDQNRWFTMLAALTGSYADFGCQSVPRTSDNGATYDEGYSLPNYVLSSSTSQRGDGLIDAFGPRIQFGLSTFDSEYTYKGGTDLLTRGDFDFAKSEDFFGMFSYAGGDSITPRLRPDGSEIGRAFYPGCQFPFYVDSGIRSASATEGALVLQSASESAGVRSQQLRTQLRSARPYGGTPIAAALDDLYFFFTEDPIGTSIASTRKRHIVLLTDGAPDPDFRDLGCACSSADGCGVAPNQLSCPYPLADDAARHLRCGFGETDCSGPVTALHVVALGVSDTDARAKLDATAAAGGTERARYATDQPELRTALRQVFEQILAQ
ncbi:MAG TPA: hypothetical protein VFG30_45360 [Polyangiales bacterium]|nr:hypothetical protein [Polyangiales bacterium]